MFQYAVLLIEELVFAAFRFILTCSCQAMRVWQSLRHKYLAPKGIKNKNVYFFLTKESDNSLWRLFSVSSIIGVQISFENGFPSEGNNTKSKHEASFMIVTK